MKILFLTNIPTPYRHYFYEKLSHKADIHVAYLAKTEMGRSWDYKEIMNPKYSLFIESKQFMYKKLSFYIVPDFISVVKKINPDILILAGSWNYPSTMQIVFNRKIKETVKIGFWSEGNFIDETASKNFLINKLKTRVYKAFDFFLSPGYNADKLIKSYSKTQPILRLTNVAVPHYDKGKGRDLNTPLQICIISRLMERKNIVGYITAVIPLAQRKIISIDILGEGEQSKELRDLIDKENVNSNIKLIGQVPSSEVNDYIKKSDVVCLPSFREPYPLTLIEAMFLSKPLLMSNTIGSLPEVLQENGFSFNPNSLDEMYNKTIDFVNLTPEEIDNFSKNSLTIAKNYFDTDKVIHHFIEDLEEIL